MTHWHIVSSNQDREMIAALRFDNSPISIGHYIDFVFQIFQEGINENDRVEYTESMLKIAEEHSNYHVYCSSAKLTISWMDCDKDDTCSFPVYN